MLSMSRTAAIAFSLLIVFVVAAVAFASNGDIVARNFFGEPLKIDAQEITAIPENVSNRAEIFVPAVDAEGNGRLAKFTVEAEPGDGKILANIDHLLFFVDTQFSIQTARDVAEDVTGIDTSKYNLIYDIEAETNGTAAVEGPSAGAALAIATIAALEDKDLDPEVMITGSVNSDGTIGKIGGIPEKAEIARELGARVFLVPAGQGLENSGTVETACEEIGRMKICRTDYVPTQSVETDESGLIIKEVSTIEEAVQYFIPN
jgi:uncharacterized protein